MKIIIISDRLTEPIELEPKRGESPFDFAYRVKDSVEGVQQTEDLERNGKRIING